MVVNVGQWWSTVVNVGQWWSTVVNVGQQSVMGSGLGWDGRQETQAEEARAENVLREI